MNVPLVIAMFYCKISAPALRMSMNRPRAYNRDFTAFSARKLTAIINIWLCLWSSLFYWSISLIWCILTFLHICHINNLREGCSSWPFINHLHQAKVKLLFEFLLRRNEATFGLNRSYRSSNRKNSPFSLDI